MNILGSVLFIILDILAECLYITNIASNRTNNPIFLSINIINSNAAEITPVIEAKDTILKRNKIKKNINKGNINV